MAGPLKGEIVVVPFPFSDLSRSKRRPALVVASLGGDDLILCQITSRRGNDPDAVPISNSDFASGGLKRDSFARPGHLFTAHRGIVLSSAGMLLPQTMKRVTDGLFAILTR